MGLLIPSVICLLIGAALSLRFKVIVLFPATIITLFLSCAVMIAATTPSSSKMNRPSGNRPRLLHSLDAPTVGLRRRHLGRRIYPCSKSPPNWPATTGLFRAGAGCSVATWWRYDRIGSEVSARKFMYDYLIDLSCRLRAF